MSKTKGGGSTRNGRDSNPQYRGIKAYGGQVITAADIIFIVITLASWAVGVGAIAMLWRSDSSAYFQAQAIRRQ